MTRLLPLLLALFVAISSSAAEPWTREPKDFRGVPFGTSRAEARAILDPKSTPDFTQRLTCTDGLLKDARYMRALTPAQREYEEREQRERGTCSVMVAEIGPVMTNQTFTFHDDHLAVRGRWQAPHRTKLRNGKSSRFRR